MLIYAGATSSSPLQDMWVFRPDDESWVEIEAVLDTPFAREGHATVMLKPKAATLRRRRLLMDGPGDVDISSGVRDTCYTFFVENTFCFVYMILILKIFVVNFLGYFFKFLNFRH
jgi:hypothetical protein